MCTSCIVHVERCGLVYVELIYVIVPCDLEIQVHVCSVELEIPIHTHTHTLCVGSVKSLVDYL